MPKNLTETQETYLRFWQQFAKYLEANSSRFSIKTTTYKGWHNFSIVSGGGCIALTISKKLQENGVEIYLGYPEYKKEFFKRLKKNAPIIENDLGSDIALVWKPLEDKKRARIVHRKPFDPMDETDWQRQFAWFEKTAENFYRVFIPHLDKIARELGLG